MIRNRFADLIACLWLAGCYGATRESDSSSLQPIGKGIAYECRSRIRDHLSETMRDATLNSQDETSAAVVAALPNTVVEALRKAAEQSDVDTRKNLFSDDDRYRLLSALLAQFERSRVCGEERSDMDLYLVSDAIRTYLIGRGIEVGKLPGLPWATDVHVDPLEDLAMGLALHQQK